MNCRKTHSLHILAPSLIAASLLLLIVQSNLAWCADQEVEARLWYFLRKYSSNSYHLVKQYQTSPERYQLGKITISLGQKGSLLRFIDGHSDKEIVASLNTLVHEICHGYTRTMAYRYIQQDPKIEYHFGDKYLLFYIDSLRSILVHQTPVFPTSEIHRTIPKKLRTPRYETYIYPANPSLGAQVDGVYGLMDEWNAYYHGTRTDIELFEYYHQQAQHKPGYWLEFFSAVNGTYYAHLEFKYYILKYLLFAHQHHPNMFDQILSNKNFIEAFLTIDRNFADLIDRYFMLKGQIFRELQAQEIECSEDEEFTFVGHHGRGNFLNIYRQLEQELNRSEYQEILTIIQAAAN